MAHFHYTIMGGLIFTFFAAIYYWVPKMTGLRFNERLAKCALLADVRRVQLDVPAAVRARHEGHAHGASASTRPNLHGAQRVGLDLGVRARLLDADLPVQHRLLADLRARSARCRTRGARSRSSGRCPTPVPVNNFEQIPVFDSDPYDYGTPLPAPARRQAGGGGGLSDGARRTKSSRSACMVPPVPRGRGDPARAAGRRRARAVGRRRGCWPARRTFFFLAFVFAYFYLRSLNVARRCGTRRTSSPTRRSARRSSPACVLSAVATILAGRRAKREVALLDGPALAGLVLGLAAVALQCIEYTVQDFGPTDGAFASVFCAWTAFYLIAVLGTMYWLETQVATRAARAPRSRQPAERRHQGPRPADRARASTRPSSTGASSPAIGAAHVRRPVPPLGCRPRSQPRPARRLVAGPAARPVGRCSPSLYALGAGRTVTPPRARPRAAPAQLRLLCGRRRARRRAGLADRRATATSSSGSHMVQHVLLMLVAAPLLVLARPWVRLWRALPLGLRRPLARGLGKGAAAAPLRAAARWRGSPAGALVAVHGRPARLARAGAVRRDAALRSRCTRSSTRCSCSSRRPVLQAADPLAAAARAPRRRRPRALYAIARHDRQLGARGRARARAEPACTPTTPSSPSRPGGISALADQQLAAGVMWVPGSITFLILVLSTSTAGLQPPRRHASRGWRAATRRSSMTGIVTILASSFQTAAVLTLVLPLGVLIAVAVWYVVLWRRGDGRTVGRSGHADVAGRLAGRRPGRVLHNRWGADPHATPRRTRRHRRGHPDHGDGRQRPHRAARDHGARGRLDLPRGDLAGRQGGEPRRGGRRPGGAADVAARASRRALRARRPARAGTQGAQEPRGKPA